MTTAAAPRIVILVAVDETRASDDALRTATSLGAILGGQVELHLVHVVVPVVVPAVATGFPPVVAGPPLVDWMAQGHAMLVGLAARAAEVFKGRVSTHVAMGSPAREIVQLATDLSADVVVVGTHNRKRVERWLLGSVSEQLVRQAPCSVIVARPKEDIAAFPAIEPPCPECVATRNATDGDTQWCERHAQKHVHGELHYELAPSYGVGSMFIRP